jgi:hypothetical protein
MQASQVRLYAVLARQAPFGIVFSRGPSKNVLLVKWNTSDDTFQVGQWLKGRIYERRCDLSPDGDLLLYFAANYREPFRSWSAISRPPFLTALAMWPKGDGWGGGGHFLSQTRIALNHRDNELKLAEGFSVPRWLKVKQFGKRPGWGEDDPIFSERLKRDGWKLVGYPTQTTQGAKVRMEFSPPIEWRKVNPKWPERYSLDMSILGIKEKDGPWYLVEHSVRRGQSQTDKIGRSDWADWSHSGDLLFAMDGCLYRAPCNGGVLTPLESAIKIADFSNLRFEPVQVQPEFRCWPAR